MKNFDAENKMFEGREVVVKALVGSHNYNLNTPNSDRDYKLFVTPTFDDLYNNVRFSTGEQSDKMDYTVHDVRALPELVWKANVNFVEVLFSKDVYFHPALAWAFDHAEELAGMNLPKFFTACMGMSNEKMRTLHKGTATTQALVNQFGYDTKQACHALRLLYVAERLSSGMTMAEALWFSNKDEMRTTLLKMKASKFSEAEAVSMVRNWHDTKGSQVREWFSGKVENEDLKDEFEQNVKDFVWMSVMSQT